MTKASRESNIELLRIFATLGVIILHYCNPEMGGGITYVQKDSINCYILYSIVSFFACGVNVFMLISGYFMCTSKQKDLWKPIQLFIQVIIFRELGYFIRILLFGEPFSIGTVAATAIPRNYFVILYCAVYVLSPFINKLIENLSEKSFGLFICISFVLFSIYPTLVDVLSEIHKEQITSLSTVGMYGSQWGYSIVNFILMYLIGAYLRNKHVRLKSWKGGKIALGVLFCVVAMVIWARANDSIGYYNERSAWEYCNPFVITEAILIFLLFTRISIGSNKIINRLSEGVFSVFLLHSVFLKYIGVEKAVTGNAAFMILHMVLASCIIYFICWCVHFIYQKLTLPIYKRLSNQVRLPLIKAES